MGTLDGKNAVVTGAGSGIGRSIAVRFAREGASVALLGRRKEMLEETLRAMPKGDHLVIPTDVTAAVQVAHAKDLIRDRWG
ncbi:MAG TPA: SDR family NAD(P)-dependent oxidoreductase, partial [Candidatus Latescibacteria bacterium]|nr:SDR family NAD(P)-dependent oxidoreductase [Candidatus Latescibacterota bacterium]HRS95662.1 SDR family NAD(P)-dependent oxidoreductase [Candidatus Latescibacterota bacterium]